jgi:hypothetical protein
MSSPKLTLDSPIRDFWNESERSPEDGDDVTHADCAWIVSEATYASMSAHPDKDAQRRWLLVARAMADRAIAMLDAEIKAEKENA